jgi:methylaspartate mutase sigma subunit
MPLAQKGDVVPHEAVEQARGAIPTAPGNVDGAAALDGQVDPAAARRARWLARRRHKHPKTIVTGVIGADCHIVGHRILAFALQQAGFRVVALGALTPAEDFVKAAIETDADAILVSSLYGHGLLDCQGFRDLCAEAGLGDMLLYVGGNLTVGQKDAATWAEVERAFLEIGFDRVYPPNAPLGDAIADLKRDLGIDG